ncbi:unnamed protein product, partial [Prunus brigantina]
MDVKTTSMNGELEEENFMRQLEEFANERKENMQDEEISVKSGNATLDTWKEAVPVVAGITATTHRMNSEAVYSRKMAPG